MKVDVGPPLEIQVRYAVIGVLSHCHGNMGSLAYIPHIDLQHTAFSPIASVCQHNVDFTSLRIMWHEHNQCVFVYTSTRVYLLVLYVSGFEKRGNFAQNAIFFVTFQPATIPSH